MLALDKKQEASSSRVDPLGVLLDLLNKKNLDISNFSLAQVADQYLDYLEKLGDTEVVLENITEFLWVASKLALIKSKILLSEFIFEEEEEEVGDLKERLLEYKKFKEISDRLKIYLENDQECLTRNKVFAEKDFEINFDAQFISDVFLGVVRRFKFENQDLYDRKKISEKIKIEEKIKSIKNILAKTKEIKFSEIILKKSNRLELVVSFLSVLELVKQGTVEINQKKSFEEIYISKR